MKIATVGASLITEAMIAACRDYASINYDFSIISDRSGISCFLRETIPFNI
jgi:hypothetical protein